MQKTQTRFRRLNLFEINMTDSINAVCQILSSFNQTNCPKITYKIIIGYGIVKYPPSPHDSPHEFLTIHLLVSSSNPTSNTTCPPRHLSLRNGIFTVPVL